MGTIKNPKEEVKNMYPPKQKNVEKLERYIEQLKKNGELRENDV